MIIMADESVDYRIVRFLRNNSYNVVAIIDHDASISDIEVLSKAPGQKALLYFTLDKFVQQISIRENLCN